MLQLPGPVQLVAGQLTGMPTQVPFTQVSFVVHKLPSEHVVPLEAPAHWFVCRAQQHRSTGQYSGAVA